MTFSSIEYSDVVRHLNPIQLLCIQEKTEVAESEHRKASALFVRSRFQHSGSPRLTPPNANPGENRVCAISAFAKVMNYMQYDLTFVPKIPPGYRICFENAEACGIHFFLEDAKRFACGKNQSLALQKDRKHPKYRNAIKVIGINGGWFSKKKYLIGHLLPQLVDQISQRGNYQLLRPVLLRIWWSSEQKEFINVRFHLIEPTLGNWGKL